MQGGCKPSAASARGGAGGVHRTAAIHTRVSAYHDDGDSADTIAGADRHMMVMTRLLIILAPVSALDTISTVNPHSFYWHMEGSSTSTSTAGFS
jgi:hypothetical protein